MPVHEVTVQRCPMRTLQELIDDLSPDPDEDDGVKGFGITLWLAGGHVITGELDEASETHVDLHQNTGNDHNARWIRVERSQIVAVAWDSGRDR